MAKVENTGRFNDEMLNYSQRWVRVLHHIGGLTGKNDNSDMLTGGDGDEGHLNLITEDDLHRMEYENDINVKRLFDLGAIRPATPDEVYRFRKQRGETVEAPVEPLSADFLENTKGDTSKMAGTDNTASTGGKGSAGSASYKGMTKGELSELEWPELRSYGKAESIEGYGQMDKETLLNALTSLGK
jgi:hypothetical protein